MLSNTMIAWLPHLICVLNLPTFRLAGFFFSILEGLSSEKEQLKQSSREEINLEKWIAHFRKVLENNEILKDFDRCVFESIVEKVIIGEIDENGNANPYKLTFVYKTGYSNVVQSKMHKQIKKKKNDKGNLHSYSSPNICRNSDDDVEIVEIRNAILGFIMLII